MIKRIFVVTAALVCVSTFAFAFELGPVKWPESKLDFSNFTPSPSAPVATATTAAIGLSAPAIASIAVGVFAFLLFAGVALYNLLKKDPEPWTREYEERRNDRSHMLSGGGKSPELNVAKKSGVAIVSGATAEQVKARGNALEMN